MRIFSALCSQHWRIHIDQVKMCVFAERALRIMAQGIEKKSIVFALSKLCNQVKKTAGIQNFNC
jgi:hypothetical protein